ncbi:MAG: tripartite tricarboxylate transporter TctB family protein [Rhodospirillaceae bacterium]
MPDTRHINQGDVWSGALLAALGMYIVTQARQWDYIAPDGPGPGFFPMWYGIALVVLSLGMIVARLLYRDVRGGKSGVKWHDVGRALLAWGAFSIGAALLKVLGFVIVYALLSMFVVCVMYRRSLLTGVVTGVAGAIAFYLIFALALDVALPIGALGF